jgi:hypothetical protein
MLNLNQTIYKSLWWIIFLFPIVIYFGFINVYAINIPYVDDHGLKGFIVKFFSCKTIKGKISAVFAQHNEHRIALTRIILLIVYFFKNEIDYKWLIWIGNFFLLGILYVFYKYFKFRSIDTKFLLPLPWVLLTFLQNENTYWGMASIQNFGIVFLCLSAFLALEKQNFTLTIIMISIAVFTSGNGFIALGIILGILIVKRNYKQWVLLIGLIILLSTFYFFDYQTPPATPTPTFSDFGILIRALVLFIGSFADGSLETNISFRILKAFIFGTLMLVIMGLCFLKNIPFHSQTKRIVVPPQWQIFIISTFMLIILSAFLVTWSRIIGYGTNTILTSRYKIYSILGIMTIYVWLLMNLEDKKRTLLLFFVLPFSVLSFIYSIWSNISSIDYHYKILITNSFNWENEIVKKTNIISMGYEYKKPHTIINQLSPLQISNKISASTPNKSGTITNNNDEIIVRGKGDFSFNSPSDGYFVCLNSLQKVYIFPSNGKKEGLRAFFREQKVFSSTFECHIPKNELENGVYHIGLIKIENSIMNSFKSTDSIIISNKKQNAIKTNW